MAKNYDGLSSIERSDMKVDEIFALYLYRLSDKVTPVYYKKAALPFVILFRECLNEYGWAKMLTKDSLKEELEKDPSLRHDMQTKEYCLRNGAE